MDRTLIQAWTGPKGFVRKDGDDQAGDDDDFKGRTRSNVTQESKTDPDLRWYRKGKTAKQLPRAQPQAQRLELRSFRGLLAPVCVTRK